MDLKIFDKELKKSLRKNPQDWYICSGYLIHRRTQVRMLTAALGDHREKAICVFAPNGGPILTTIPSADVHRCYNLALEEIRKKQEQLENRRRDDFLADFPGFN